MKHNNEPTARFHTWFIILVACGCMCSSILHVSRLLALRFVGAIFLPCAFVADAACDVGVHRFARWPRVALICHLSRWPLACILTLCVVAYALTSIARPARAGVCV
jgi:hypothetical protein